MTDRARLAERLEQRARMCCPYVDQNAPDQEAASRAARNNADLMVLLREAAEWLRRGCETCRYRVVEVSCDDECEFLDNLCCATMGYTCGQWRARP